MNDILNNTEGYLTVSTTNGTFLISESDSWVLDLCTWSLTYARRRLSNGDHSDKRYYIYGKIEGKKVMLHTRLLNPGQGFVCDHINGDGTDNRRENIRVCTKQQNSMNRKSMSGYKGVRYDRKTGMWNANIGLGTFDTAEQAALAYDRIAKQVQGEYAKLNFPEGLVDRYLTPPETKEKPTGRMSVRLELNSGKYVMIRFTFKGEYRKVATGITTNREDFNAQAFGSWVGTSDPDREGKNSEIQSWLIAARKLNWSKVFNSKRKLKYHINELRDQA